MQLRPDVSILGFLAPDEGAEDDLLLPGIRDRAWNLAGAAGLGACGFDAQAPPCCGGYVVLKQAAASYGIGTCAPIGGRVGLPGGGYATVNADGSLTPCCLISGTCYPVGTHVPAGVVGPGGTQTYCVIQPDCSCIGGTAPGGVPTSAYYDASRGCIVQPGFQGQASPPCNAVDPTVQALAQQYGIAQLAIPVMSADGKTWAGPPQPTGAWVPAVLSPAPRPPSPEEVQLIQQRGLASDAGDTDIYRFDLKGVHYVAWYFPNNAFTQALVTAPDKNTGAPRDLRWMLGTMHIEPWQEGWDNVIAVLGQTVLNFLEAPFRAAGYVLSAVKDLVKDLLCGDLRTAITAAATAAAAVEHVPPTMAVQTMNALCGGAATCLPPMTFDPTTGLCTTPTSPWLYVGLGAAALAAVTVGYLALRPKRKAAA